MSLIGAETFKWEDAQKRGVIMWRVPRNIKLNDNIVVREDEYAVFYRDGKVLMYIDRPDRYALTSLNAPIVGRLVEYLSGVRQQAEVIWIQRKAFDGKYGSKQPFPFKDVDFGIVNLRIFGEFRYRVIGPENFIHQFVGTMNLSTAAEVESRIKEQMVVLIYDVLGEMKERGLSVVDIASQLTEIEQFVLTRATDHFEQYGLEIDKLSGLYVSMPEKVQEAVDTRSSMQVLGTDYMGYQTGQALEAAANQEGGGGGGLTGAGMGLGAGAGMGYMMMDSMARQAGGPGAPQQAPAAAPQVACVKCQAMIPAGTKFCPQCGAGQSEACPKCNAQIPPGTKFCPECGEKLGGAPAKCDKCGAEVKPGAKFCPEC
ncbi:MAG: SPFH domain-containing protein, partial [Thermoplasmata archaeon]